MGYFDEPEESEWDKYMRESALESLKDLEIGYKGFADACQTLKKYKKKDACENRNSIAPHTGD